MLIARLFAINGRQDKEQGWILSRDEIIILCSSIGINSDECLINLLMSMQGKGSGKKDGDGYHQRG
jgi:hypothetical protein